MNDDKKREIDDYLLIEQAKADAVYPYKKDSLEPVVEGAWKGALVGGIGKVLHEAHKQKRLSLKGALGYYGTGGVLGAIAGYINNAKKVKAAKEAREFLYDRRKNNEYVKEKKKLLKSSAAVSSANLLEADEIPKEIKEKQHRKKVIDDIRSGTITGAGAGLVLGLIMSKGRLKNSNVIKSTAAGGVLGGTQAGVGDELQDKLEEENKQHNLQLSLPMQIAITTGASSAIEPIVYRLMGAGLGRKNIGIMHDRDEVKNALKEVKQLDGKSKTTDKPVTKALKVLLPNIVTNKMYNYDSDDVDMMLGSRRDFKHMGRTLAHSVGKALWGGLLGYGLGKGIEYIVNKHKSNEQRS